MGAGEGATPRPSKPGATAQEVAAAPSYAEWTAAFQAYYGAGVPPPPGFFPSTVASAPQKSPYLWGGQPLMPPFATPPAPHAALYPYGGMYPHPSLPPGALPYGHHGIAASGMEATIVAATSKTESEAQPPEGGTAKRSNIDGSADPASESANCDTQSGETGSEALSENNEEIKLQNEPGKGSSRGDQQLMAVANGREASRSGDVCKAQQKRCTAATAVSPPATNLQIGVAIDYWNGHVALSGTGKRSPPSVNPQPIPPVQASAELWLQDEKELKRQRRKQSNRESARRSRLRKQAECEELSRRVEALSVENMALRGEISRLTEERKKLCAENQALLVRLEGRAKGMGCAARGREGGEEAMAAASAAGTEGSHRNMEE